MKRSIARKLRVLDLLGKRLGRRASSCRDSGGERRLNSLFILANVEDGVKGKGIPEHLKESSSMRSSQILQTLLISLFLR